MTAVAEKRRKGILTSLASGAGRRSENPAKIQGCERRFQQKSEKSYTGREGADLKMIAQRAGCQPPGHKPLCLVSISCLPFGCLELGCFVVLDCSSCCLVRSFLACCMTLSVSRGACVSLCVCLCLSVHVSMSAISLSVVFGTSHPPALISLRPTRSYRRGMRLCVRATLLGHRTVTPS